MKQTTEMRSLFYYCSVFTALLIAVSGRQISKADPKPWIKAPEGSITTGHHIVVLNEKSDLHDVMERVKRMSEDVTVHRYTEHVGKTLTLKAPDHVMEKIRHLDEVSHIEEEDFAFGASCEDCKNESLWFLDRLNQPHLPLDNIYTFGREQEAVDVYVLDSGIEFEHSEFDSRAKYAGYDPMDEYHVTTVNVPDYQPKRGRDCNGHGTLVASLIGGKTYGTAKKVNLFSVRVLDCQLSGATSVLLDGLNFIATEVSERKRPAIVSMALYGRIHSSLNMAITTLHSKNVLVVGSAGNAHSDACGYFPGNNDRALRVGATTADDTIFENSNYGRCVDIFAPGESIKGADPSCPTCTTEENSGTSLASALVCGIAAVHLSQLPLMKPADLKQKVIELSTKNVLDLGSNETGTQNRLAKFDCGGMLTVPNSTQEVLLMSPNFPKNYQNSTRCTWTIHGVKGSYLYIQFYFLKLEQKYDWLKVCDGSRCSKDNQLAVLTGNYGDMSCGYSSSAETLTLELHTDETTTSTGFKAKCMSRQKQTTSKECDRPPRVTAVQLDAESHGANVGNRFSMSKDWEEVFGGRRRGVNIAVIDEVLGEVTEMKNFDTYISSLNLAHEIEDLRPGAFVVLSTSGNAANNLDTRAKRAIATLGSAHSYSIDHRSSWALVGVKGLARGRAIEHHDYSHAAHVSTQVKLQTNRQYGVHITVMSSGNHNGADASITVNGQEVEIKSEDGTNTGLNVVVIDENSGKILDNRVFNTHAEIVADHSPSDLFVDFIDGLSKDQVVAIAINGDAITHLTERAKQACEKIGSRLIRDVQIGRSWAIIGRKDAVAGEVAESMKFYAQSWATYYLPLADRETTPSCKISAASSANWYGCSYDGTKGTHISIGNDTHPDNLCLGYGITIGLVDENSCEFEQTATYNVYSSSSYYRYRASNDLASFINNIATGRIVVATITYDGVRYLYSSAKTALESIGSAHIQNIGSTQAWVIIGRKGAASGSVPEAYHAQYTASISATIPLTVPELPTVSSCEDSIYPLNCRAGMKV